MQDRKLIYAFAIGGFIFVNVLLGWWFTKSRTKVGGRDEGVFVSSEIATSIAHCSNVVGALIPGAGPFPKDPATAHAGYMAKGDELLPAGSRCAPAKLPWQQHWNFVWVVDAPNVHGHLRSWIDRDGDGQEDDSIDTEVVCTGNGNAKGDANAKSGTDPFNCKVPGAH